MTSAIGVCLSQVVALVIVPLSKCASLLSVYPASDLLSIVSEGLDFVNLVRWTFFALTFPFLRLMNFLQLLIGCWSMSNFKA